MILLPILCYHEIGGHDAARGQRRSVVPRELFVEQMAYLRRAGYRCVTLGEARNYLQGERRRRRVVVLTFDDGTADFYGQAYPVLKQHGFSATVFVVAQAVGGISRWSGSSGAPLMSWREIQELARQGIEIGSHALTHSSVTRLPLDIAREEVRKSRRIIQGRLGTAVHSFCYPYGDFDPQVEMLVTEAGYNLACSTVRGNLHTRKDLFHLKRILVNRFTSIARLRRRLSPLYDLRCRLHRLRSKTSGHSAEVDHGGRNAP